LDEALGLAVGLGRIGPGADVLQLEPLAGAGEGEGFVTGAIVGHDAIDGHAEAPVVGHGGLEEGDRALGRLVRHDGGEGDAGGVVDARMDELPAGALAAETVVRRTPLHYCPILSYCSRGKILDSRFTRPADIHDLRA
jgi:hypothetical protein